MYTYTQANYIITSSVAEQLSFYHSVVDHEESTDYVERAKTVSIQNRRYLGNKYKLVDFIGDIIEVEIGGFSSLCDIFAGTGVVGHYFNSPHVKIISNDLLFSNFVALDAWLGRKAVDLQKVAFIIEQLNSIDPYRENYASLHFGNRFFTEQNARKIGAIRELIEFIQLTPQEKHILLASLVYAIDKVANTCGHYDVYRKSLDSIARLEMKLPDIVHENNQLNDVYQEDANSLIKKIECDVLYIDPPYNSRQYCDTYHLLENIALWEKPEVHGKARKMSRDHLKSRYCLKSATEAFEELIHDAKCKHILLSYNNTGEKKDGRSNARLSDDQILSIFKSKGTTKVFEREYKAFTTGLSETAGHTERIFYCRVR